MWTLNSRQTPEIVTSKNQSRPSGLLRLTFQQSIFSSSRAKRRASPLHPEHSTCLEANSAAETRKSLFILADRWLCGLCAVLNGNDSALDKHQQHQGCAVLCRLSDRLSVRPTAASTAYRSDRSHSPALAAPVILCVAPSTRLWSTCSTTLVGATQQLYGGIQDLGEAAVTELLLDWIDPFITRVERDRMVAWHLGVSL